MKVCSWKQSGASSAFSPFAGSVAHARWPFVLPVPAGGTMFDAFFTCASAQVGQVILSLPHSLAQTGMVTGRLLPPRQQRRCRMAGPAARAARAAPPRRAHLLHRAAPRCLRRHLHDAVLCDAGHVDHVFDGGALPGPQEPQHQGGHLVSRRPSPGGQPKQPASHGSSGGSWRQTRACAASAQLRAPSACLAELQGTPATPSRRYNEAHHRSIANQCVLAAAQPPCLCFACGGTATALAPWCARPLQLAAGRRLLPPARRAGTTR